MIKKILIYVAIVLLSLLGTALFMCYHHQLYAAYGSDGWLQVLGHSLPHHFTVAGYVMALPLVVELANIWYPGSWHRRFMAIYMTLVSVPLLLGWFVNMVLYGYWGICLDSTALIYLQDNPKDAMAESPLWAIILLLVMLVVVAWVVKYIMLRLYAPKQEIRRIRPNLSKKNGKRNVMLSFAAILLCGLDFVAIRGGITTSTQNPGRAYFSPEMPLNHAAVNPVFNFLYSLGKKEDFSKQYRFMSAAEAADAMQELGSHTTMADDPLVNSAIVRTSRPNILLVIFESFSGSACKALHEEADEAWMPSVNRMYREGLGFTRFYANSFRTDRGVAAVLASYPGQPTNSVMKDQSKCDNLQFLSKRLGENGYQLQFIHGGDVNFTNMQGFLRAGNIMDIVRDTDFPIAERLSKWGVPDHLMFDYVFDQLKQDSQAADPFFKVFLTLSSHEPFDVPYHHFDNEYINSVAYADSCFGSFIDKVKADTAIWNNLLVIGLPDHCFAKYPEEIQQHDPLRYHIPMFWTGGALLLPQDSLGNPLHHIDVLGQQTDLSATLLGQLGIPHDDFNFSKDLFDPMSSHYAFFSFSDGFGMITDSCCYVQDNKQNGVGLMPGTNDPQGKAETWGKAYLQTLYDDLSKR